MPVHYRLDLKIDPTQESFSGTVAIDVIFGESRDGVWLHGKNMDVTEVYLTQDPSGRINASYEEHLESGVALVSLEKTAEPGPATLHLTFSAPFNTSSNALFKAVEVTNLTQSPNSNPLPPGRRFRDSMNRDSRCHSICPW